MKGVKVAIIGDIMHSRVAQSNIYLLKKMGAEVIVCGPPTLIPKFILLREMNLLNTFAALVLPFAANGYLIFLLKNFFDSLPQELYAVDRDVIRNAIIFKPAEVTPVGDSVGLVDETVWFNAREPIAQLSDVGPVSGK